MASDDLRDDVLNAVTEASGDNGSISFPALLQRIVAPGACVNCLESPVRRALVKLLDDKAIFLTTNE